MTVPAELSARLADRYALQDVLGRGGMATVYRATDRRHGREVAVKVLRPDLAASIGTERFLHEIEIAAGLAHPHILPLHESGEAGGFLFYVMPLVDGESLRGLLNRVGLMDVDGALEIAQRVADALDYAHRKGVIHRDIKPENILLPDGHAVVTDFGIAKAVRTAATPAMTKTGIALGTPGYMSPEQAAAVDDLDARTDVFSLGVVVYEMLTGGLPGRWLDDDAVTAGRFPWAPDAHRAQLDRLPAGLERVLARAVALRPDLRFPSAGELADALRRPGSLAPVPAPPAFVMQAREEPLAPQRHQRPTIERAPERLPVVGALGAPTTLEYEEVLEGELESADFEMVLDEIRAATGIQGEERTGPGSLTWSARPFDAAAPFDWEAQIGSRAHLYEAPRIQIRIVSRQGRTRIHIEQKQGDIAGGLFGGIAGGAGGGGVATILSVGLAAMGADPWMVGLTAVAWGGTMWILSREIFRGVSRSRSTRLQKLLARITDLTLDLVR